MPDIKGNGKKVRQENEPEQPLEPGSSFIENLDSLIQLLRTRKGRDKLRRLLGPPLPGINEVDVED